ncbi:MAG: hypothetical protein DI528_08170 [Shinella sp.]|nr:MAG: hypothetical protein DI528_08170 [Shinella sp.]
MLNSASRANIELLALRLRHNEDRHKEDSTIAKAFAYIACDLEDGSYDGQLAAHYHAFCEDERTAYRTGRAAAAVIQAIEADAALHRMNTDDFLKEVVRHAGLPESDGVEFSDDDN